jgi:hypothetical protein
VTVADKLYVFGGEAKGQYLNSIECYDIKADTWELLSVKLPKVSASLTATMLDQDRVVLLGGENSEENHSIPRVAKITGHFEDTWHNGHKMLKYHFYHGVTIYQEHLYVLGGNKNCQCERISLSTLVKGSDPDGRGQWEELPSYQDFLDNNLTTFSHAAV